MMGATGDCRGPQLFMPIESVCGLRASRALLFQWHSWTLLHEDLKEVLTSKIFEYLSNNSDSDLIIFTNAIVS